MAHEVTDCFRVELSLPICVDVDKHTSVCQQILHPQWSRTFHTHSWLFKWLDPGRGLGTSRVLGLNSRLDEEVINVVKLLMLSLVLFLKLKWQKNKNCLVSNWRRVDQHFFFWTTKSWRSVGLWDGGMNLHYVQCKFSFSLGLLWSTTDQVKKSGFISFQIRLFSDLSCVTCWENISASRCSFHHSVSQLAQMLILLQELA